MRFFLGMIVGVLLTIGVAYMSDASISEPSTTSAQASVERHPMVNWDVVNRNWQNLTSDVRNTWNKLAAR
jgi:hypothetical protein